jgi:hypothetical protein
MVYRSLYDVMEPLDFIGITTTIGPRLIDGFIQPENFDVKASWPRMIRPGLVHADFAKELIDTFYSDYEGIAVLDATEVKTMLTKDHFELGICLSNYRLPSFAVCIRLDRDQDSAGRYPRDKETNQILPSCVNPRLSKYVDPADLDECFAPLLHDKQRLAPGFKLAIVLCTEWEPRGSFRTAASTLAMQVVCKAIIAVLQACQPLFAALKAKCSAEIKMSLECGDHEMDMEEEHMKCGMEDWVGVLEQLG